MDCFLSPSLSLGQTMGMSAPRPEEEAVAVVVASYVENPPADHLRYRDRRRRHRRRHRRDCYPWMHHSWDEKRRHYHVLVDSWRFVEHEKRNIPHEYWKNW